LQLPALKYLLFIEIALVKYSAQGNQGEKNN
jgi:hypothetical protein